MRRQSPTGMFTPSAPRPLLHLALMNTNQLADLFEEFAQRLRGMGPVVPATEKRDEFMNCPLSLLEKARLASMPKRNRVNTDRWLPVCNMLRNKGWSWVQIYDYLKSEGEPVQEVKSTFISSMSRRYINWLTRQARETGRK